MDIIRFPHSVKMKYRNHEINQFARLMYSPFNANLPDLRVQRLGSLRIVPKAVAEVDIRRVPSDRHAQELRIPRPDTEAQGRGKGAG